MFIKLKVSSVIYINIVNALCIHSSKKLDIIVRFKQKILLILGMLIAKQYIYYCGFKRFKQTAANLAACLAVLSTDRWIDIEMAKSYLFYLNELIEFDIKILIEDWPD